jgi:2-succinyl-5-enolpyruvyl-6-hydroxy-3-cyclohexene-1-carboxylate synthase
MSLGDLSLACASLLVDELVLGGVRHACISPGSRSTPIALALARHDGVEVHVHLDERSSAFVALGIAEATGAPVAIACTSGTAAAEFWPAVVEASQARIPLVVLTADRPPRLRGTGANQTIDQVGLYGTYVRDSLETPLPWPDDGATWRQMGARAVRAATARPSGPVHINLPFEEPLSPSGEAAPVADAGPVPALSPLAPHAASDDVERLASLFSSSERGVLVIGSSPSPPTTLVQAATRMGWPVLAEPTSGVRIPGVLSAGQALLGHPPWLEYAAPRVIVQAGATPTTRASQAFVATAEDLAVVDEVHLDPDPEERASVRIHADPELLGAALDPRVEREDSRWHRGWDTADGRARAAIDGFMDAIEEPFEPRVARDLAAWTPAGATLFVGNSTPIRDLDLAMTPRTGMRVLANRGASGIDGLVSTAIGVASQVPTVALLGDLSFLYDAGAWLWNGRPGRGPDLVLVVIRNGGGEVFSLLPQAALPEHRELFTTPHEVDLEAVCAAAGCGWRRVDRSTSLVPALDAAAASGGIQVVEVMVDAGLGLRLRAQLKERVAASLA